MATVDLVTKPFSFCMFVCLLPVKTAFIVFQTCVELVKNAIYFHLDMFRRVTMWAYSLVSLPVRVSTAMQREALLEQSLRQMQFELETLEWDRNELEDSLQAAIKEHRIMGLAVRELEEEHDKAISKVEMLQRELLALKEENLQLRERQGKGSWDLKVKQSDDDSYIADDENYGVPYGIRSRKSGSAVLRDALEKKRNSNTELLEFIKGDVYSFTQDMIPKGLEMSDVLDRKRGIAIHQSVFSAVLSLLVGIIIWEAEDPCMPLVGALFAVVGMSLKSVVNFFSTIRNRPASDAVALLSLNWFLLGTLTYPTLPRIARIVVPLALRTFDRALG